jgi:hypothetical protein
VNINGFSWSIADDVIQLVGTWASDDVAHERRADHAVELQLLAPVAPDAELGHERDRIRILVGGHSFAGVDQQTTADRRPELEQAAKEPAASGQAHAARRLVEEHSRTIGRKNQEIGRRSQTRRQSLSNKTPRCVR